MKKTVTGVIGSGAISGIYLTNMIRRFANLEVKSIASMDMEGAKRKAEEFGITACTVDELLADPEVEIVVVLVPVGAHYSVIKNALLAGKHVYTEKTMCETVAQAKELCALAEEKGLYLGSAPDTFLGTAVETGKKALLENRIGDVHSFSMSITRSNDVLTAHFPFLRLSGAGALRDYLVYYLTALVSMLGPVESVYAKLNTPYLQRLNTVEGTNGYGNIISTPNEAVITAVIRMKNGITGTVHEDNETIGYDRADFTICGREGVLVLGNPNEFGGEVTILRSRGWHRSDAEIQAPVGCYSDNSRGIGPAEMADAIVHNRKNRTDKYMALHVLEVIEAMEESNRTHTEVQIHSDFEIPALFEDNLDHEK